MGEILSDIFKKFGIKSVLFALAFSVAIWTLAHFAASPGTEVSILWGLARYTKSMDKESESSTSDFDLNSPKQTEEDIINKNDSSFVPISLFTKYDLTKADVDKFIIDYRKENNIREIQLMESGKPARQLSDGIFSFIEYFFLTYKYVSLFGNDYKNFLLNLATNRFRMSDIEFEIHFINKDKIVLLGYTNRKDASDITFLSGKISHSIILSPHYFGDFNTLVVIPVNRIIFAKDRRIEISKNERYRVLETTIK